MTDAAGLVTLDEQVARAATLLSDGERRLIVEHPEPSIGTSVFPPDVATEVGRRLTPKAKAVSFHPLPDEFIAMHWPGKDVEEIRHKFDVLMDHLVVRSVIREFPRFPEHMADIVAEKARTLPDRINALKAALDGIPEHLRQYQWAATKPAFGEQGVVIAGDNGHGYGRQWVAAVPARKPYFGTLGEFIAAANPDTVGMMVAQLDRLMKALNVAVGLLAPHEPPDSRAVSDIFVALASIVSACDNDECWQLVDQEAARQRKAAADAGYEEYKRDLVARDNDLMDELEAIVGDAPSEGRTDA